MSESMFSGIHIERDDFVDALHDALAGFRHLRFLLKWTPGHPLLLTGLEMRPSGATAWTRVIEHPVSDNDGDIPVTLGDFPVGQVIEIRFGVFAMDSVPKAIALILENAPPKVTKLSPRTEPFKALSHGESWRDSKAYKVGGEV